VRLLVFIELVAGSIWTGGLIAIGVAARTARNELAPAQQVQFFRTLGRSYLRIGGAALVTALGCGLALLTRGSWSVEKTAAIALGSVLLLVTGAAVAQARALSRLNASQLQSDHHLDQAQITRQSRQANTLRASVAILTLAELTLAASMIR
jgi:putative copper export protein